MVFRSLIAAAVVAVSLLTPAPSTAQAYAPIVMMSVTLPDGQVQQISAPESGLALLTTRDGTEYGFRPTMQDDRGEQTVVTIFRMNPSSEALGSVSVKMGAAPVPSKTTPAFRIGVTKVSRATT